MKNMKGAAPIGGFVYVFSNPLFPQWVKIGRAANWQERLKDYQQYAPEDFVPIATLKTSDMVKAEQLVHGLLEFRERRQKEFFCIPSETAISVLRSVATTIGEIGGLTLYEDGAKSVLFRKDGSQYSCRANPKVQGVEFHANIRGGTCIRMEVRGDEYVVLKGSKLRQMTDSLRTSEINSIASIRADREAIEADPTKCSQAGRLLADVPFKSSSRALAVMLGRSAVQGPRFWVDEEGRSLSEYLG